MASANDFQIVVSAKLDTSAASSLRSQLRKMKDLEAIVTKAQLSNSAIEQIRKQLSDIDLTLKITNSGDIKAEITSIGKEAGDAISEGMSEGTKDAGIEASAKEIEKLRQSLIKLNESNSQGVKNYEAQIQEMVDKTKSGVHLTQQELEQLQDEYTALTEKIKESNSSYDSTEKAAEGVYKKLGEDAEVYGVKVDSLVSSLSKWGDTAADAGADTQGLQDAFTQAKAAAEDWAANKSDETKAQTLVDSFNKLDSKFRECQEAFKHLKSEMATDTSIEKIHNDIVSFVNDSNADLTKYSDTLTDMLTATSSGASLSKEGLKLITDELKRIKAECGDTTAASNTLFSSLTKGVKQFLGVGSVAQILNTTFRVIKSAVTDVKDLDTALIDLRKTTTMTTGELEDFYYAANDVAKQMGVTTEEIISQAAAWSRLGYSSQEAATQMAALSSQFAAISPGMDVDTATNGLVSIMKANYYMPLRIEICAIEHI